MKKEESIVIIGNSGAAINAIKGIRNINADCPITLFSREGDNAYSPVLTTYLIAGKITKDKMPLVDEAFYRHYRVETHYNQRVISINTTNPGILLEDGKAVGYDKLLIASGALPNPLDCSSPTGLPVFALRTIGDAEKIQSAMSRWNRVIFAGAGLVSMQTANALRNHVRKMVFVDIADQILPRNLDRHASLLVQRRIEAEGGTFFLNQRIVHIEEVEEGIRAHTDQGETITGNALLVGMGVHPNIPQVVPDGIVKVNQGIRVDKQMRTSAESIFAAGDVCETTDLISGEYRVVSNWPNACFQGWVAGQNMGGGEAFFEGSLAMNVTSIFGLSLASIGEVKDHRDPDRETASYFDESRGIYKRWVFQGDRFIGAILVGEIGENALVAEVIRRGLAISREKKTVMADPSKAANFLCGLL